MAEKEVKVIKKEPAANIAFIGEEPWKPLIKVHTASGRMKLPEDQSKPFYHAESGFLIRTFPHLYKAVKAKGE